MRREAHWNAVRSTKVWLEIFLAGLVGLLALLLERNDVYDDDFTNAGHSIVGVSLSFLCVFRSQVSMRLPHDASHTALDAVASAALPDSRRPRARPADRVYLGRLPPSWLRQIAWGMYLEGRNHVGALIATTRQLAVEILSSLAHAAVEDDVPIDDDSNPGEAVGSKSEQAGSVEVQHAESKDTAGGADAVGADPAAPITPESSTRKSTSGMLKRKQSALLTTSGRKVSGSRAHMTGLAEDCVHSPCLPAHFLIWGCRR